MKKSKSIKKIGAALIEFQSSVPEIKNTVKNPEYNSSYIPLNELLVIIKPHLASSGLTISQMPSGDNGLTTILIHESGEWLSSTFNMPMNPGSIESRASIITYQRRYAIMSILGISSRGEDLDSNIEHKESDVKNNSIPLDTPLIVKDSAEESITKSKVSIVEIDKSIIEKAGFEELKEVEFPSVKKKKVAKKEEVKAEPVKEEVKAEPVKEEVKAEAVKEEVKAEPVKEEVKAEPVKEEVKAEPVKEEVKAEPVKEETLQEKNKRSLLAEIEERKQKAKQEKKETYKTLSYVEQVVADEHKEREAEMKKASAAIENVHAKNKTTSELREEFPDITVRSERIIKMFCEANDLVDIKSMWMSLTSEEKNMQEIISAKDFIRDNMDVVLKIKKCRTKFEANSLFNSLSKDLSENETLKLIFQNKLNGLSV